MAKKEEKTGKTKRPTALKRDIQNRKRRSLNKSFKNRVKSAVKSLEASLAAKETAQVKEKLNEVYSLMDKGVNRGTFKKNKASRTKSRLTARAFAATSA